MTVRPEFCGLGAARHAGRSVMYLVSDRAGPATDRLSFVHAVRVLQAKLPARAMAGSLKKKPIHDAMRVDIPNEQYG